MLYPPINHPKTTYTITPKEHFADKQATPTSRRSINLRNRQPLTPATSSTHSILLQKQRHGPAPVQPSATPRPAKPPLTHAYPLPVSISSTDSHEQPPTRQQNRRILCANLSRCRSPTKTPFYRYVLPTRQARMQHFIRNISLSDS